MSILDELEAHAQHASRMQNATAGVQSNVAYFRRLERKIPLYKTLAVVGVLIPFFGWAVVVFVWLVSLTITEKGSKKEAVSNALVIGGFWGFLTFGVTWVTNAIGFTDAESIELMLFYAINAFLVVSTFRACKRISSIKEHFEIAAEHIASQNH
ncbi:hypothetical protein [Acidithiobacillus thiooxidans]|uniref:hypothetical protein n=1 Tax=Acidithiobacillus thiooxidans TaxID=930 RepID=UPI0004E1D155|nr:hypothetical protein [Acidithiobacillus thiooxidans]